MAKITYKYRLYPTRLQERLLESTLDLCCELYNAALQERKEAWKLERKSISGASQSAQLPELKKIRTDLQEVHSHILQNVIRRLDRAFQGFFRRIKVRNGKSGFPRFQPRRRYSSFTCGQTGFSLKDDKLRVSKIGDVKVKLHRPIKGKIKMLTVTRSATGKWYACFSMEAETQSLPINDSAVGVDVGLTHFVTLSTGEQIDNPRFFRTDEKALAKAQRCKRRKAVRRIHERIKFRRCNFAHQLSRDLVNRFGLIVFEDLNIRGMMKNHRLAKSIADAAWNQLFRYVSYKAEWAGGMCKQVDPRNTSRLTACCGELVELTLGDRVIHCPKCHSTIDRDRNASLNILARGLASLASA